MQAENKGLRRYAVLGCLLLLAVGLVAGGTLLYLGYRVTRTVKVQLTDPARREQQALSLLGADRFPDGYRAMVSISMPVFGTMVVLSEETEGVRVQPGSGDAAYFFYLEARQATTGPPLDDPYDALGDFEPMFELGGFSLTPREKLGSGILELEELRIRYVAERAELSRVHDENRPVLFTAMEVFCPGGGKTARIAMWITPDPDPGVPLVSMDGTIADPAAIEAFLASFDLCSS